MRSKSDVSVNQPFTYYGGKQNMVRSILPLLPSHRIYCEPFCGGASLFWAKKQIDHRDYIEVLNDLNEDIVITYRVLKTKAEYDKLVEMLNATLYSKAEYKKASKMLSEKCPGKVDRARAFIVCQQMSFGHIGYSSGWGISKMKDTRPEGGSGAGGCNIPRRWQNLLKEYTEQYTDRLKDVYIDCDDAIKVIKRWDDHEALFYVDPPYPDTNQGNFSHNYGQDDFIELIEVLKDIKGSFILSCFPNEAVPDDWKCVEFDQRKSAGLNKNGNTQKRKIEKVWIVDKSNSKINNGQFQLIS